jgi:hypothetical protein
MLSTNREKASSKLPYWSSLLEKNLYPLFVDWSCPIKQANPKVVD